MKLYTLSIVIVLGLIGVQGHGIPREEAATKFLTEEGYTEINITGTHRFGCGRDDVFKTTFKAKNPRGIPVEGTVCEGLVGAAYIRR